MSVTKIEQRLLDEPMLDGGAEPPPYVENVQTGRVVALPHLYT